MPSVWWAWFGGDARARGSDASARARAVQGAKMDETAPGGAVDRVRGELDRRRQEAYRIRAAATVKIQRWYRRRRGAGTINGASSESSENANVTIQSSVEEPYTEESKSATLSTVSEEESQGD